MQFIEKVGPWVVGWELAEPHPNTTDHFLTACRFALNAFSGDGARQLGLQHAHVAGSISLRPYDSEKKGAAGWYREEDDHLVVMHRRGARTDYGKDPAKFYGPLPQSGLVATVVHEAAHRAWYRLSPSGRVLWGQFMVCLDDSLTRRDMLGMARLAELRNPEPVPLYQALDVPERMVLQASGALSNAQIILAEVAWEWYRLQDPGLTPADFHAWLREGKYLDMLPTRYASSSPEESWPEAVGDVVLYGAQGPRTIFHLVRAVLTSALLWEGLEEYTSSGGRHDWVDIEGRLRLSLGVKRRDMPQVRSDNVPHFLTWLRAQGVSSQETRLVVGDLKPTQNELDQAKVYKMAEEGTEVHLRKRVLVSSDNHVLDGHHRWAAMVLLDPSLRIPVIRLGARARSLLQLMRDYPRVEAKGLREISEERIRLLVARRQGRGALGRARMRLARLGG